MTNQLEALIADMKAAANKAKQADELYLEKKITLSECAIEMKDYLDYSDNPKNFLALIAALEQSQEMAVHLREQRDEEERKAISNFEECASLSARLAELEASLEREREKSRRVMSRNHQLEASQLAVKLPDLKKLSRELVENLVDCASADGESVSQYLEWTEKTIRAAGITVQGDE